MRLSPVWISSLIVATLCFPAPGQDPGNKDTQATEVKGESKGMPPRATPGDYQAQAQAGAITIAAEFTGHSVPRPEGPLINEDHVVVEIGLFGAAGTRIQLSISDFSLRINGRKTPSPSEPYTLVTGGLKDPEWSPPEEAHAEKKSKSSFGTGGEGGDSTPPIIHVPIELRRAMALHVQKSALPEGDRAVPVAGLIFFEFRGKTKSIKTLELIYKGPAGEATLKLQP